LNLPLALHLDAAGSLFVNLAQRGAIGDDLATEREVRSLDLVEQLGGGRLRVFDEENGSLDDFTKVMRRDVRRHADGDTGRAVDQQIRKLRRQNDRLLAGILVVG